VQLNPEYTQAYFKLAAVNAELKRPAAAIEAAQKGLDVARAQGQTAMVRQIEAWLTNYHAQNDSQNPATQSRSP
jgi:hypothetical protein